jgi:tRNA G18 (ribose-2'-O)-methylase SpoU
VRSVVTGVTDARLAAYAALGDPQRLARDGVFVAEGRLVLQRLVAAAPDAIESVLLSPAAAAQLAETLARLDPAVPVFVAPVELLAGVTGFNIHRGCLAIARRPAPRPLDALLPPAGAPALVLVLERLANPDNVGGAFRNALAFGATGVLLDPATADPLYRKAIRTSMAATLTVPWTRSTDWPADLDRLAGAGLDIVALVTDRDVPPLEAVAAPRVALLVGHEGEGLSAAALAHATRRVRIAMAPGADSLNAATAAGIALHHAARACGTIAGTW